jgi:hypothetical protein
MKTLPLAFVALATALFLCACSSSAKVGTSHHHVSVGGSVH